MTNVPSAIRQLLTPSVARELGQVYGDRIVFPDSVIVDKADAAERRFPGWPTDVLVVSVENQGVCAWGVPVDENNPPVVVGGDLAGGAATVVYAPDIKAFAAAREWDATCLRGERLVHARASALDDPAIETLERDFAAGPHTAGHPGARQLRYARDEVRVLLWLSKDATEWCITADSDDQLLAVLDELVRGPLDRKALQADDPDSAAVLTQLSSRKESSAER